jgi:uncharacterized membrane protein YqgA involved in biofilm formation
LLGTIINTLAIIIGSSIGAVLKGGIPKKYNITVMQAVSLAVILVGLQSALKTDELLSVIFSLAIGSVVGEFLRIEQRLEVLGQWLQMRFSKDGSDFGKGFVTASLIYCVGSMAIVGSLESGLAGNHQTLFAKSVLDGIASIVLASTLGIGVAFSALSVFIYQGGITLAAALMKSVLIPSVINQMSAVGGLLIMGIGFNLMEIKKIKVGNMLPAIAVPLAYYLAKKLLIG